MGWGRGQKVSLWGGKTLGQAGMFGVCLRKGGSLGEWLEQGFYGAVRVGGEGASGQILGVLEI